MVEKRAPVGSQKRGTGGAGRKAKASTLAHDEGADIESSGLIRGKDGSISIFHDKRLARMKEYMHETVEFLKRESENPLFRCPKCKHEFPTELECPQCQNTYSPHNHYYRIQSSKALTQLVPKYSAMLKTEAEVATARFNAEQCAEFQTRVIEVLNRRVKDKKVLKDILSDLREVYRGPVMADV